MVHERTGVDHVCQPFADRPLLDVQDLVQPAALGRLGDPGTVPVYDLFDLLSLVIDENDCFLGRPAADTGAILLDTAKVCRDEIFVDQGTDTVVDQHCVCFPPVDSRRFLQPVIDGHLPRLTAGDDGDDLFEAVGIFQLLHIGNPVFDTNDDDPVDLRMAVEYFHGMDNDGLAVHKKKLLGAVFGVHSLSGSARKDHGYIFNRFIFIIRNIFIIRSLIIRNIRNLLIIRIGIHKKLRCEYVCQKYYQRNRSGKTDCRFSTARRQITMIITRFT